MQLSRINKHPRYVSFLLIGYFLLPFACKQASKDIMISVAGWKWVDIERVAVCDDSNLIYYRMLGHEKEGLAMLACRRMRLQPSAEIRCQNLVVQVACRP
jgi:hypothetical protein